MKKLMKLQITVLFTLFVFSLVFCLILSANKPRSRAAMAENQPSASDVPVSSQTLPPETTEPAPTWMTFPRDRALKAQQYFVYDCDTNTFLKKSGDGGERIYPASVTKLFTAHMATLYLDPQKELTAGDVLDRVAWGSSVADLKKGDVLTTDRAVEAMLLPSGNDAAYVLAVEAGKVLLKDSNASIDAALNAFMADMNAKAKEMGMTGTHFVNPDGIHDENHYTTFDDLAILGKLALNNPTVLKNAGNSADTVTLNSGEKKWRNTNALVDPESTYYCPHAVGLKTGQTPTAGSCLLSAFQKDGKTLLIGVFGCPQEEDRFEDTLQLFNEAMGIS